VATYFDPCTALTNWSEVGWCAGTQFSVPSGNIFSSGSSSGLEILNLDLINSDGDRDDVEIYFEFSRAAYAATYREIASIRGSGDSSTGTCYTVLLNNSNNRIARNTSPNAVTAVASVAQSHTDGATYGCRFRANGSALKLKIWLLSDGEPSGWDIETTDANVTAAGFAGPSSPDANVGGSTYYAFGVGTNGDTAPTSAGGAFSATGALTAQAATVAGAAAAVTTFTSSGALSAQAATVAGTANHVVTHASSGALEAQAATVAGSATRVVVHGSTGVLEAQAATVSGSADHSAAGAFSATGALSAQAATVAGSAAHLTLHTATGALVADSATAAGSAVHYTLHTATGDLVADAASVAGAAVHPVAHDASGALEAGSAQVSGSAANDVVSDEPSGRIVRRRRTKFPKPPEAPEVVETPEEPKPVAPSSVLDGMQLVVEQANKAIKKARVASAKRRLQIDQEDERAIEKALLEWF